MEGKEKIHAIVSLHGSNTFLERARVGAELGQMRLDQIQRGTQLVFCKVGKFLNLNEVP